MKILKPSYNSHNKVYTCELVDGFRLSVLKEGDTILPNLNDLTKAIYDDIIDTVIKSTKGWFSTPLTQEWLLTRVKFDIPIQDIQSEFEGTVEFQASHLVISKETFLFQCPIVSQKEAEKVVISFEEEIVEAPEPDISQEEPMCIGPTRRILQKEIVIKARNKAARALFAAERMTQEFLEEFGDTDWEIDEESDSD